MRMNDALKEAKAKHDARNFEYEFMVALRERVKQLKTARNVHINMMTVLEELGHLAQAIDSHDELMEQRKLIEMAAMLASLWVENERDVYWGAMAE